MEPPYPGPNLLLPSLGLSGPPDLDHYMAFKRREAKWKQLVSTSHKAWCLCGSYLNHFLPSDQPLLSKTCTEEDKKEDGAADTGEDLTIPDLDGITDEDIIAAGDLEP